MVRLGRSAALGAFGAAAAYDFAQILQVAGALPDPVDRILIFAPSLVLAPLFVIAVSATLDAATPPQRPWRRAALCLAILYAAMASLVYVNQLGVVIPADLAGRGQDVALFACCGPRRPMTAVDLLGYTYMALSLALLAPTYARGARRTMLIANGLLAPFLILQLAWPALIWIGALWIPLFAAAMLLLAREPGRSEADDVAGSARS
jgi:type IV secretory pathway TrbD component